MLSTSVLFYRRWNCDSVLSAIYRHVAALLWLHSCAIEYVMSLGSVFGSRDNFSGLAVFLDTYANQNGQHNVSWVELITILMFCDCRLYRPKGVVNKMVAVIYDWHEKCQPTTVCRDDKIVKCLVVQRFDIPHITIWQKNEQNELKKYF